jgi:hypothetical protein
MHTENWCLFLAERNWIIWNGKAISSLTRLFIYNEKQDEDFLILELEGSMSPTQNLATSFDLSQFN